MPAVALRRAPAPAASAEAVSDADFLGAIGRRLREARERQGKARKAVAQVAGVSERYLAQLEGGIANASVLLLRNVAHALGMSVSDTLAHKDHPVEERLIRRVLDGIPAHRLEDVVFRLMRDFGDEATARRKRIALIGLRGAGKSTLGSALAAEMGVPFVELDREIEKEAGIPLAEVFLLYGQAGYRRIERRCLQHVLDAHRAMVMTVGGGLVSEPEAYHLLLSHCFTVWVRALPDEHMARVLAQGDMRPIEGNTEAMEDLNRILRAREPLYRKADITLDTSGEDPGQSLSKLRQAVAA